MQKRQQSPSKAPQTPPQTLPDTAQPLPASPADGSLVPSDIIRSDSNDHPNGQGGGADQKDRFGRGTGQYQGKQNRSTPRKSKTCTPAPGRTPDSEIGRAVDRAIRVLWPWKFREYPGWSAMVCHVTGSSYSTVHNWIYQGVMPPYRMDLLSSHLRYIASEALKSADELDALSAEGKVRKANRYIPWLVVKERDGPGSVPRDGRWRRGNPGPRKKKE